MAGKRIDDHSSWVGSRSKGSVFPMGVKTKDESSAEGAGSVGMYQDTTESIKGMQEAGVRKVKGLPMREGYRH